MPPHYVQRGVMTDPTEFPMSSSQDSPDISGNAPDAQALLVQSPRPLNQLSMKFSEMHGTPSPTPSPIPASPGTAYLVKKMTHNTLFSVSSRCTPHASPHAHRHHQSANPESSPSSPNTPNPASHPTISNMAEPDHNKSRYTNVAGAEVLPSSQDIVESQLMSVGDADSLREMDIDSALLPGLNSQWQPQSQLPLHETFDTSSLLSTVNPSQLHPGNMGEI